MEKAPGNKVVKRCKWYGKGKQALFPVEEVITGHVADIAFVYTGTVKAGRRACVFLHSVQNTRMMRMRTGPAGFSGCGSNRHARGGIQNIHRACELVKLEVCGNKIINFAYFFRHRVEIRQKKGYHNPTGRRQPQSVRQSRPRYDY